MHLPAVVGHGEGLEVRGTVQQSRLHVPRIQLQASSFASCQHIQEQAPSPEAHVPVSGIRILRFRERQYVGVKKCGKMSLYVR